MPGIDPHCTIRQHIADGCHPCQAGWPSAATPGVDEWRRAEQGSLLRPMLHQGKLILFNLFAFNVAHQWYVFFFFLYRRHFQMAKFVLCKPTGWNCVQTFLVGWGRLGPRKVVFFVKALVCYIWIAVFPVSMVSVLTVRVEMVWTHPFCPSTLVIQSIRDIQHLPHPFVWYGRLAIAGHRERAVVPLACLQGCCATCLPPVMPQFTNCCDLFFLCFYFPLKVLLYFTAQEFF